MNFDLARLAQRLAAAAERAGNFTVSVSGFDLILSRDGFGTERSESVPFALLFLSEKDVLAEALARLESAGAGSPNH